MPRCPSITSAELIDSRWRMRKSSVNAAVGAPVWQPSRSAQLFKSSGISVLGNANVCWWSATGWRSSFRSAISRETHSQEYELICAYTLWCRAPADIWQLRNEHLTSCNDTPNIQYIKIYYITTIRHKVWEVMLMVATLSNQAGPALTSTQQWKGSDKYHPHHFSKWKFGQTKDYKHTTNYISSNLFFFVPHAVTLLMDFSVRDLNTEAPPPDDCGTICPHLSHLVSS